MSLAYPARIWRDDEGFYQVEFPDVPAAITYGDDTDHAREMAREALSGVLGSMLDRGLAIPRPSAIAGKLVEVEPDADVAIPILLRFAREDAKLTQAELASRIGITQQAYQKLERAGANPTIKTLGKAARALQRRLAIAI